MKIVLKTLACFYRLITTTCWKYLMKIENTCILGLTKKVQTTLLLATVSGCSFAIFLSTISCRMAILNQMMVLPTQY